MTNSAGDQGRVNQRRIIVECAPDWPSALAELKKHMGQTNVLGFDCEWVEISNWHRYEESSYSYNNRYHPSSANEIFETTRLRNGRQERVSLMQMATYDGLIVLVRLVFFEQIPSSMKDFLADGNVLKIGVNIFEDCARLYKDWGLLVNGWLDLRNICMEIPNFEEDASNTGDSVLKNGLKALGSRFCENTIPYDQKMRYSNWCSRALTESQLHYASQDAIIAVKVLAKLGKDYLNLKSVDDDEQESKFWSDINTYVRPYVNRKHDADRQQAKKSNADASSKRKNKKEEVEDSSSDVDMDWNTLNETCSNRDALLFYPKPYIENGKIIQNKNVIAAVSPLLLSMCDRHPDMKTPPVKLKVDSGTKRYIFKMSMKKVDSSPPKK